MTAIVSICGEVQQLDPIGESRRYAVENEAGLFEVRPKGCIQFIQRSVGQRIQVVGALYVRPDGDHQETSYIDPFYIGFSSPETPPQHLDLLLAVSLSDNKCAFCPWIETACVRSQEPGNKD